MPRYVQLAAEYDPITRRWRGTCPVCGFVAVRRSREVALHYLAQHVSYTHNAEPARTER